MAQRRGVGSIATIATEPCKAQERLLFARQCASGCLPELDVVGLCVARWVPAGWHVIANLDCACQGVWIPRVVGGHSVGNIGAVQTGERMYSGIQCPLSVDQMRLRRSRCIGSDSYCGAS